MIYANPIPAAMASGAFYDAAGKDYYLSPAKLESDYAEVRFERELRLFRKHCPRGFVLDVGCDYGPLELRLLKLDKRRTVHLVDRDALAVDFTQQNAALNNLHKLSIYGILGYAAIT